MVLYKTKALKKQFIFSFIFLFGFLANANIDTMKVEVVGASNVVMPTVTQTGDPTGGTGGGTSQISNIVVYGGITGAYCTGSENCNNCDDQNSPCNLTRINPDAMLSFKFRSDKAEAFSGSPTLFFVNNANTSGKIDADLKLPTVLAPNIVLESGIRWGHLCAALSSGDNSRCTLPVSGEIQVGVSSGSDNTLEDYFVVQIKVMGVPSDSANYNDIKFATGCPTTSTVTQTYEGFCYLTIAKGDEKVYIDNEIHGPNFNKAPPDGSGEFQSLRVYYAEGPIEGDDNTFAATVNSNSPHKDFSFTLGDSDSGGKVATLNERTITGLNNGTRYYFQFANVDAAGNVFYFSGNNSSAKPLLTYAAHSAKPEEVTGIIESSQCFIATAAYGSALAPQLNILRAFRNQYLNTNKIGRWLVTQYYKYSPEWAAKIKRKEEARATVRAVLNPIVSATQWLVLYGLQGFILISTLGFFIGFFIVRRFIQSHE